MIMNRISDVFFTLGIALLFLACRTTDFVVVFNLAEFLWKEPISFLGFYTYQLDVICFFFFIGAVGKSAQLGLHTWLPDAMEGPTPVSALLHAATMVTAGVFLIIRTSPLFEYSPLILSFISIIGLLTALFSALVGVFQYDIKKLIAFSTCSQLGYMFFSCGFSAYHIAIFHLFNHAFFKALLFLGAGAIIHALGDEQDMRRMGRLLNFIPFTYFVMFIASVSIMGFPFLTGFYSKDLLLEFVFVRFLLDAGFIYCLGVLTAFFTAVYSCKLLLFVFFYNINGFRILVEAKEDSIFIYFPLLALVFASIFVGYIFSDIFVGFGFSFLGESLFFFTSDLSFTDMEVLSPFVKNMPLFFSVLGCFSSFSFFLSVPKFLLRSSILQFLPWLRLLLFLKSFFFFFGYFNVLYNHIFLLFFSVAYYRYNRLIDKGVLEIFGPFGFYKVFRFLSFSLVNIQPYQVFFILG
jgi:proton-translocating NADH-quinone oxidoreductase chain L